MMEIQNKELHRVVSTAIIYKKDRGVYAYLLIKRSLAKKAFPGKWTVPGGGLQTDDYVHAPKTNHDNWYFALEKSLRREIREETGIEAGMLRYLLDLAFIRPDGIPAVVLSFYGPYKSGTVRLDEDSVDFAWVRLAEAKSYDLVEGLFGEIEMVEKILNS